MPYDIRKGDCPDSKPHGVYKRSDGQRMGCHETASGAQRQIAAIEAQEAKGLPLGALMGTDGLSAQERAFVNSLKALHDMGVRIVQPNVFKAIDEHRWIGWWSNNLKDKENEIIRAAALKTFIGEANAGRQPMPELWWMHIEGTRHGKAERLYEIELQDGRVWAMASGVFDPESSNPLVKVMKQWYAKQDQITMSHGFGYLRRDYERAGTTGLYKAIRTTELSTTKFGLEANPYTTFSMMEKVSYGD